MCRILTQRALTGVAAVTALLAFAGCPLQDRAEMAVRQAKGLLTEQKPCTYGHPGDCPAERFCASVKPGRAECVKRYVGATPFLRFPFEPSHAVACIQGPQAAQASNPAPHDGVDTIYALDLASRDEKGHEAAPGTVYAAIDGTALVYRSCADGKRDEGSERPAGEGAPLYDDPCGNGLGNHVRILNRDGYLVLYAHLGSIFVEDGQVVHLGEPIGREGRSGRAFRQHLHFSAHYVEMGENWLETLSYYRGTMGVVPPSIPFETQFCDPAQRDGCHRKRARMDEVPCAKENAPLLKADWRS